MLVDSEIVRQHPKCILHLAYSSVGLGETVVLPRKDLNLPSSRHRGRGARICSGICLLLEWLEEAGLEVVAEKRKHFGTVYFLVCKPASP